MGERQPGQRSFVCSFFDCKAEFSKSWKLEAHLCKHTGLVSGAPKVAHGGAQTDSLLLSPQKPFSCESCERSFCTRYQLTRHELSHSGEKPHKYERASERASGECLQRVRAHDLRSSGAPSTAVPRPSSPTAA